MHAIMDTCSLVANVILKRKECEHARPSQQHGQESQAHANSGVGIVNDAFALAKNCTSWQHLYSILKARLLSQANDPYICEELHTLRLALIPFEEYKVLLEPGANLCWEVSIL